MRPSDRTSAWPAWLILGWTIAVLGVYTVRMIEARRAAADTVFRVIGIR